jgi:hypothetical protein
LKGAHPLPFEEFLRRARAIHGDRYDYSLAQEGWRNTHGKVVLICPVHGPFEQVPGNHLRGHGCALCGHLRGARAQQYDLDKERFTNKLLSLPSLTGNKYAPTY